MRMMKPINGARILGVLLIGGAGLWYVSHLSAASFYADELGKAHVYEHVVIGNASYIVDRGTVTHNGTPVPRRQSFRVLSLAYEKVLAERSPLLALPGVQPDRLMAAVVLLKDQQEQFARSQKDTEEADLVRSSLFPIQFLESAAALEQARKTFIGTGNAADAARYRSLLKSTAHAYTHDLEQFRVAFQAVVPTNVPAYGTDTYIIDYSGTTRALDMLEDGIEKMKRTLWMRTLCRHGMTGACNPDEIQLPETQSSGEEAVPDLKMIREVTALYKAAGFRLSDEPSVTLTSSSCIPNGAPATFSFIRYGTPGDNQYLTPLFTGDILFIQSASYGSAPFYQYFKDNGISYVPVDPLTFYECPEASRDFASTRSVLEIIRFAKEHDPSLYLIDSDLGTISVLRNRLLGTMVYERDAEAYMSALRTALPLTQQTESLRRILDELFLASSYKTAGLTEFVSTIVQFEEGNRLIAKRGVSFDTGARNLFYIRSGFGSLFLITSPAVLNASTSPFRVNTMTKSQKPYVQYSGIKTGPGIRATIQKDMTFFWNTHIHL